MHHTDMKCLWPCWLLTGGNITSSIVQQRRKERRRVAGGRRGQGRGWNTSCRENVSCTAKVNMAESREAWPVRKINVKWSFFQTFSIRLNVIFTFLVCNTALHDAQSSFKYIQRFDLLFLLGLFVWRRLRIWKGFQQLRRNGLPGGNQEREDTSCRTLDKTVTIWMMHPVPILCWTCESMMQMKVSPSAGCHNSTDMYPVVSRQQQLYAFLSWRVSGRSVHE